MIVDLIRTDTDDGISTVGALYPPRAEAPRNIPVDSMLLIHGSGTSFYAPHGAAMAEDLSGAGIPCLSFNTRGHDIIWRDPENGEYYGNAYEILDDCNIDLKAGMDYLWGQAIVALASLGIAWAPLRLPTMPPLPEMKEYRWWSPSPPYACPTATTWNPATGTNLQAS